MFEPIESEFHRLALQRQIGDVERQKAVMFYVVSREVAIVYAKQEIVSRPWWTGKGTVSVRGVFETLQARHEALLENQITRMVITELPANDAGERRS